jgi:hypothetical protein
MQQFGPNRDTGDVVSGGRSGAMAQTFEILYLAENPMVALFEARSLFGSPATPGGVVPHPNRPLVTLPILVSLGAIADGHRSGPKRWSLRQMPKN